MREINRRGMDLKVRRCAGYYSITDISSDYKVILISGRLQIASQNDDIYLLNRHEVNKHEEIDISTAEIVVCF